MSRSSSVASRLGAYLLLAVFLTPLLYAFSFGPVMWLSRNRVRSPQTINALFRFYGPLMWATPSSLMRPYVRLCGFSRLEAHFLVEGMKSEMSVRYDEDSLNVSF